MKQKHTEINSIDHSVYCWTTVTRWSRSWGESEMEINIMEFRYFIRHAKILTIESRMFKFEVNLDHPVQVPVGNWLHCSSVRSDTREGFRPSPGPPLAGEFLLSSSLPRRWLENETRRTDTGKVGHSQIKRDKRFTDRIAEINKTFVRRLRRVDDDGFPIISRYVLDRVWWYWGGISQMQLQSCMTKAKIWYLLPWPYLTSGCQKAILFFFLFCVTSVWQMMQLLPCLHALQCLMCGVHVQWRGMESCLLNTKIK